MRYNSVLVLVISLVVCTAAAQLNLETIEKARNHQQQEFENVRKLQAVTSEPSFSQIPTMVPSRKPTAKPAKPTQKPSVGIYGPDNENIKMTLPDQQAIVGSLTGILFVAMAMEILSPEILFLIALMICMLTQILTLTETLSGFANESMITIGALFLVIGAVEKSHIVDFMARKTFGMTGSETVGKIRMYCSCFVLSIFFNNTPLVAILLPVVKDWGRVRGIAASQLLIPLSFSVLSGSFVSMIGTSSNLTIQGIMQADRGYSFGFFEPAPIGLPLFVVFLFYQVVAGPYLLPHKRSGLLRAVKDKTESLVAEVYVSKESLFVGKSVETMMNALGIAASRAIKIRRRVFKKGESDSVDDVEYTAAEDTPSTPSKQQSTGRGRQLLESSLGLFDLKYVKRAVPFWTPPAVPESAFDAVDTEEERASMNDNVNITADHVQAQADDLEAAHKAQHDYLDIIAPSANELMAAGDVIFISSAQDVVTKLMKSIAGENKGLYILKSNVLALPGYGTELIECVVSDTNPFIGKRVGDISVEFSARYKAGIITARSKDWASTEEADEKVEDEDAEHKTNPVEVGEVGIELTATNMASTRDDLESGSNSPVNGQSDESSLVSATPSSQVLAPSNEKKSISDHIIQVGDVILCAVSEKDVDGAKSSRDFFVVSTVGQLPKPITWYLAVPPVIFIVMLILVATQNIDMCPAALVVASVFFMGGWITYKEIPKLVDIRLLMLLGTSLSFAKAMSKSGLAITIAESIQSSSPTNYQALILIYAITLIVTELISNNAAGALMYPIAVALADQMGVSFKPFAMVVLFACAAGFMCPTGYQTHVMVWGPGGYNFKDFVVFGFIPDLIYWIGACSIIYGLYSFEVDA